MKRIHILESRFKLLSESYWDSDEYEAGTDFPKFYDKKTDTHWEANWDTDYGMPFAYWPTVSGAYKFYVGDPYRMHKDICLVAAEEYIKEALVDDCEMYADEFIGELENLLETLNSGSYKYDEVNDVYVSADSGHEIDLNDWAEEYSNGGVSSDWAYEYAEDAIGKGQMPDIYELADLIHKVLADDIIADENRIDYEMSDYTKYQSFDEFFRDGYGMGRIWPEKEMIGFYTSEQPDPNTFYQIIGDLSNTIDNLDIYNFFIIFEDYDNDGVVTGCTVSDYIKGNYGPETDNDEEPDLDRERTFGDGNTQMNIHLASPEEKKRLDVFKGWREAGARKWAPRLKGFGGNMAAYRAARYPYSDSKIIRGNVINEGDKHKKSRH